MQQRRCQPHRRRRQVNVEADAIRASYRQIRATVTLLAADARLL
jgi:hypothetical protein